MLRRLPFSPPLIAFRLLIAAVCYHDAIRATMRAICRYYAAAVALILPCQRAISYTLLSLLMAAVSAC